MSGADARGTPDVHDEETAAILAAEDRRRAATVAGDIATLDALFADDLVHIHSNALVHDKAGILAHIGARRAFVAIERGPLRVRRYGDVAVLTGRLTNHLTTPDGPRVLDGMATQVLRREDGAWRFVNFQLTLGNG
ncbi:MAG: nuclear transport factor 2 family protein [Sphingomonas adhaesiva]|uniref:nuclear transport factor 2 family protein n=1 Tax=Sphingomonas adhaesiva TaxID=28212 RepID=UPI002FF6D259